MNDIKLVLIVYLDLLNSEVRMKTLEFYCKYIIFYFAMSHLKNAASLPDSAENSCLAYFKNLSDEYSQFTQCAFNYSRPFRVCQVLNVLLNFFIFFC